MYKQVLDSTGSVSLTVILRLSDNAFIPKDHDNRDWQEYQTWLSDGNTPLAAS